MSASACGAPVPPARGRLRAAAARPPDVGLPCASASSDRRRRAPARCAGPPAAPAAASPAETAPAVSRGCRCSPPAHAPGRQRPAGAALAGPGPGSDLLAGQPAAAALLAAAAWYEATRAGVSRWAADESREPSRLLCRSLPASAAAGAGPGLGGVSHASGTVKAPAPQRGASGAAGSGAAAVSPATPRSWGRPAAGARARPATWPCSAARRPSTMRACRCASSLRAGRPSP